MSMDDDDDDKQQSMEVKEQGTTGAMKTLQNHKQRSCALPHYKSICIYIFILPRFSLIVRFFWNDRFLPNWQKVYKFYWGVGGRHERSKCSG
jgi:hypothetical protein